MLPDLRRRTPANDSGPTADAWGSRGSTPVVSTGVLTGEVERGGPHARAHLLPRLPDRFLPAPPPAPHRPTVGRAVGPRLLRRGDRHGLLRPGRPRRAAQAAHRAVAAGRRWRRRSYGARRGLPPALKDVMPRSGGLGWASIG